MFALLLLVYVASTQATYYIGDKNSSISYTPVDFWVQAPDGSAFDDSLTHAFCTTLDNCQIQILFTGSGVTLYIAHDTENVNASITVDDNPNLAAATTIPAGSTAVVLYGVPLYNIQSLAFGAHRVTVQLLSWVTGGNSSLWFEYAAVNTTQPSPNAAASPSPSTSSSSHSHLNTGAIAGGVVGGLVALTGMIAVLLCLRRMKNKRENILEAKPTMLEPSSVGEGNTHSYPLSRFANASNLHGRPSTMTSALNHTPLQHLTPTSLDISNALASTSSAPNISSPGALSSGVDSAQLTHTSNLYDRLSSPNTPPGQHSAPTRLEIPMVLASRSPPLTDHPLPSIKQSVLSPNDASSAQPTNEQIEFITRLASENVPAADIARVMERMRAGRGVQETRDVEMGGDPSPSMAPPDYDFV